MVSGDQAFVEPRHGSRRPTTCCQLKSNVWKRRLPVEFRQREPAWQRWDELGYDRNAVSRALTILSRSFRFSLDDCARLQPGDRVRKLYWRLYPGCDPESPRWRRLIGSGADEMEMETLLRDLRRAVPHGKDVDLHHAITVRDLVDLTAQ